MNNSKTFKRKKIFIQPAFQRKFIIWGMSAIILASVLSAFLLYFLLTTFYQSQSQSAHIILLESWHRLGLTILLANVVALMVGLAVVGFVILYRSHKIAGPLYRFCQVFDQVANGNLTASVQLRDQDELAAVAESIQSMLDQLQLQRQQRQQHLQTALQEIQQIETQCDNNIAQLEFQRLKEILQSLQQEKNNEE